MKMMMTCYYSRHLPLIYFHLFPRLSVMCTHGAMALPSDILGQPNASAALVRAVVGFMRNLCADDMRKENLGTRKHFSTHMEREAAQFNLLQCPT
jgi:hypothetical protein